MTSIPKIEYVSAESLYLDTQNPRLGREMRKTNPSQEKLLDWLKSWSLDEIAESFLVSGFWPQEPLIVVKEKIGKNYQHVVVEGNRRLATLKWMRRAIDGDENAPSRLKKAVRAENIPDALFQEVPCIVVPNRGAVSAYRVSWLPARNRH